MRDKCVEAVTRAALSMGRTISQTDLRGIEDRMLATRREMARSDRDKFLKMSEKERLEESARRATEQILHEALKKKQRAELQIAKDAERKQILEKMQARGLSPAEALTRYTFFHADGRGGIVSMESSAKAVSANWKRQLAALWDLEHSNLINIFTDKKAQRDFFNELYGGDSGNPLAKKAAQQYNALLDKILVDMNDIGFDIPKMVDYRSPQKLSWYKVWQEFKKDPDAIVRDWMAHVDRTKYVNNDGTVMNDAELSKFLREAVQTIATDGLNKPVGQGSGSVANLHKQHRQLHWKDADSFMYIMDKYSESNPIDMIWSQLDRMGREYAMVQKFGPNAIDGFKNEVGNIAEGVGAADTLELRKIEEAFDSFLGIRQAITHPRTHRLFSNLRQMQSAALLGSNTITQLADQATLVQTARAMNIPVAQAFTEQLRQASSAADREVARSLGLGIESIATNISRVADSGGEGFWGKASNAVLTLNLSNHLTTATRSGFGVAMMSHIGSMVRRFDSISKLSEADRRVMESKGVTDEQWSLWKMAAKDPSYKDVVSPDSIAKLSDAEVLKAAPERLKAVNEARLSSKAKEARLAKEAEAARQEAIQQLLGMTIEETHMASLQPSILATQPLKNQGELGKLFFQFKQFPLAYFTQHVMQRSAMGGQGIGNRAKYLIPLIGISSILGGMALLIGDIASGRDPREAYNEDDPRTLIKFGMAAFFKGGGLGILADLMNPENALTTDPVARQVGPGVGYGVNVLQLGHKSLSAIFAADEAERGKALEGAGGEVAQIVKSSIPGQNIWYTRAVLHNLILNDMHELMSPGYKDRLKGATERNFGSGYWIGGDEGVRAPNLSNIMGQD